MLLLLQDVNQENICCMNTAVLQFVVADMFGALEGLVSVRTALSIVLALCCGACVHRSSICVAQDLVKYADTPFSFPALDFSPFAFEDIPPRHDAKPHSAPAAPPKRLTHSEVLPNFVKLLQFWG